MQNGDLAGSIIELEFYNELVYDIANFKTAPVFVLAVLGETEGEGGRED